MAVTSGMKLKAKQPKQPEVEELFLKSSAFKFTKAKEDNCTVYYAYILLSCLLDLESE